MHKPKISIIVPVYNTSKFLDRCLHSISKQTFKNIEILTIDDGSTDRSLEKLKQLQLNDPRIIIHSQQNQGLSAVRNTGINLAKADIISFIDSDDTIELNMIELMYNSISHKSDVDIVFTRCNYLDMSNNITKISNILPDNKNKFFHKVISNELSPGAPLGLYKKSLFINNNIFYPEQTYFEDIYTTYKLIYSSNEISIVQEPLYNYYYNKNSISNSLSKQHIVDLFNSVEDLNLFLTKKNILKKYSDIYINKINNIINYVFYKISQNNLSTKNNDEVLQDMWSVINNKRYLNNTHISKKLLFYYMTINTFDSIENKEKSISKYFTLSKKESHFLKEAIISPYGLFVNALKVLKKSNVKEVYLYGAGTICKKLIPVIEKMNIKILNIIDKNAKKESKIKKYTIISLKEFRLKSKNSTVLITSEAFALDITLSLKNLNSNIISFYQDFR